jgi:Domain of unknown function (DUF397)
MPALDFSGARWHKSSHSSDVANCVEVAFVDRARWHKSSHSSDTMNCVEVAFAGPVVALRDSKNPTGGVLALPPPAWRAFTTALRDGALGH